MNPTDEGPLDTALRRVLAESGATRRYTPPEELVQKTLRRMPPAAPHALYAAERSQHMAGRILRWSSLAAVVLVAGLSGWGVLSGISQFGTRDDVAMAELQAVILPPAAALPAEGLVLRATLAALVGLGLLVPATLLLGRWPKRTGVAARALANAPLRALLVGVPLALLLSALVPPAVQLGLTIVGLPLAVLLATLALGPQLVGLAALARALGARFEDGAPAATLGWPTAAITALLVFALAAATLAAPLAAFVAFSLLAAPGLGATVLSRAGTRI
jgi:hypothetical protein